MRKNHSEARRPDATLREATVKDTIFKAQSWCESRWWMLSEGALRNSKDMGGSHGDTSCGLTHGGISKRDRLFSTVLTAGGVSQLRTRRHVEIYAADRVVTAP